MNLVCGDFCKNLPPGRQSEIIQIQMKKDFGTRVEMYAHKANYGAHFQKKYIIDAKWWRSWCDYTTFELVSKDAKEPDPD
mmetsp:Transcript_31673/g.30969  ORF Transcript_31673/g.30969 Transcript_31673/m.30969 type:complete len:80 (-) Transcript_31673:390-629(-)